MRISSPRLRRIDNALADLPVESEAMLLSELDGYLAGVIVCPDLIPPGEWLPLIWSSDGDASQFADDREAKWYVDLVMDHYNAIMRTLNKNEGRYAPFLEVDARHDEVLWELWISGFEAAMNLRPDSWTQIAEGGDERATAALADMKTLVGIARDESDLAREIIDRWTEEAPALIPQGVVAMNAWRLEHHTAVPAPADTSRPAKMGRNDPCSCGSGKKYKKCCGLN